jgi:hypothetical protein
MKQAKSYSSICENFLSTHLFNDEPLYNDRGHYGIRIFSDRESLYSYGFHFELARFLYKTTKSGKRTVTGLLVNGDRASNTTTVHQTELRSAIRALEKLGLFNVPVITIPFSALSAARIEKGSIKVLNTTEDTTISVPRKTKTPPKWNEPFIVDSEGMYNWTFQRHILGESLIQANVYTNKLRKNVKFLSGFDHNENHLAYFFCELPTCKASTVEEAYEALKPDAVKLALQMGKDVKRQGDIFAIPVSASTQELIDGMKRYGRRNKTKATEHIDNLVQNSMLLGTSHQGTEVIHAKDGNVYAKGCLWHVPDNRRNDHARVNLGSDWHIIVKNTVPIVKARTLATR